MTVTISMVALDKDAKISGNAIAKAWAARWPDSPLTNPEKKDNILSYRLGEYHVILGFMPAPIPWSDLEAPCRTSPFWDNAAAEMQRHARHLIITVMGDGNPVERMKVLTQATVAVTEGCEGVVGVYWCNSALVVSPKKFCEIATTFVPAAPALPIWVNYGFVKNADGTTSGFTRGLAALELMEFETQNSPEPPEELRHRLLGLAAYVIENGPVIEDGNTIGEDASERIKVNYGPSSFGNAGQVMRLDYASLKGRGGGERLTTYGGLHAAGTLLCTIGFGWMLYAFLPLLRDSFLRHLFFIPATLVFGFLLLLISDRILQKTFGLEAFAKPKA
jgi:hypothetical protein